MSSIVPGYNYDIFISYRQKDNKHDGWVTEFVENLNGELEATFKEEISVYFDINPHDGLLETHDVDESLKEKLKCLIFIPILSRTYCDPKAFAWEHEYKTFVEQASNDQFGLKVKLSNGNVASRVLPIVIYDLDKQDVKLFESVIGSVLRGVEFIYKTAGVNRPLRSKEEKPHDNLNHTLYRDQVNKVANTLKDVLNSLTLEEPLVEEAILGPSVVDEKKRVRKPAEIKPGEIPAVSLLFRLRNLTDLSKRTWQIIVLTCIIVFVGLIWLYLSKTPSPPDRAELRSDIPVSGRFFFTGRKSLAISHNGEYLVYVTPQGLNLKSLKNDAPASLIPGTKDTRYPVFSPDDNWITFELFQGNKLMKIPLTGVNPISICDLGGGENGMNWFEKEIIYAVGSSIYRVPDMGGTPELLYPLNKSENDPWLWNPQLLPDEKTILFSQLSGNGVWSIMIWRLGSKEDPVVLVERGKDGRYLKSGHLVYSFNNRLYICKFNSRTNRIVSEPQIIATNPLFESVLWNSGASQFDFSDNGILVYLEMRYNEESSRNLVWINNSGTTNTITRNSNSYLYPSISSDAQNIAVEVSNESGYNVYIINTKLGTGAPFIEDAQYPVWSKGNSSIMYVTPDDQVFQKLLDNNTPPVQLFKQDIIMNLRLGNLSSDGNYLTLFGKITGKGSDIGYFDMFKKELIILDYYNSESDEGYPAISPDGYWIAFRATYGGDPAIYVAPFPGPGQLTKVSSNIGDNVWFSVWAPDMSALYYITLSPDYELWKVSIETLEPFSFKEPQLVFNGGLVYSTNGLAIHPDGDRLIAVRLGASQEQDEIPESHIKVIVNWEQELDSK